MDVKKLCDIKVGVLRRTTKELICNKESLKAESERLVDLENSSDYDEMERQSRVRWQKNVVDEHEKSIPETRKRLTEAIDDLESFIAPITDTTNQLDKGIFDEQVINETINAAKSTLSL